MSFFFCTGLDYLKQLGITHIQLMPTYDFIQHILSMSREVEVISPEHVRKEVIRWIKEMTSVYNL
jgi:predicted DNA-binding transcriptional regulator YafY